MKRLCLLVLLVMGVGVAAAAQTLAQRARALESALLSQPKQISFPPQEVVSPGNGPLFVYLAEHGREPRVRVGALLAMKALYRGKIRGRHSYENLPYEPTRPDAEVRRVTLLCLRDPDPWVRKKAWGVAQAFLESEPPDPEVVRFVAQALPSQKGWESRYATGCCYYLSQPEPSIEKALLQLARTTADADAMVNIDQQLTVHSKLFPSTHADFYRLCLSQLRHPNPVFRGCATEPLVVLCDGKPSAELKKALLDGLRDPSPFVRSRVAQALGKLKVEQARPELLKLLDDTADNHGAPNLDGSPHRQVRDAALRALHELTRDTARPFVYALQSSYCNGVYPPQILDKVAAEAARAREFFGAR